MGMENPPGVNAGPKHDCVLSPLSIFLFTYCHNLFLQLLGFE